MQEVRRLASKLFAGGGSPLGNEIFSLEVRRWSADPAARASVPTAPGADPTLMRMVQLAGLLGEEESVAERTTEYVCSGEEEAAAPHRTQRRGEGWQLGLAVGAERRRRARHRRPIAPCCALPWAPLPSPAPPPRPSRPLPTTPHTDALRQVGEDERRERFSFALARTLDLGPEKLQQLLYTQVGAGWLGAGWLGAGWWRRLRCGATRALTALPRRLRRAQSTAERLRAAEALILEGRNYLAARSTLRDSF